MTDFGNLDQVVKKRKLGKEDVEKAKKQLRLFASLPKAEQHKLMENNDSLVLAFASFELKRKSVDAGSKVSKKDTDFMAWYHAVRGNAVRENMVSDGADLLVLDDSHNGEELTNNLKNLSDIARSKESESLNVFLKVLEQFVQWRSKFRELVREENPYADKKEVRQYLASAFSASGISWSFTYLEANCSILKLCREYPGFLCCGATRTELRNWIGYLNPLLKKSPVERVFWKTLKDMSEEEAIRYQSGGGSTDMELDDAIASFNADVMEFVRLVHLLDLDAHEVEIKSMDDEAKMEVHEMVLQMLEQLETLKGLTE